MKKQLLIIIIITTFLGCENKKNESKLEQFASNIIESLRDHDLQKFKDNSMTVEVIKTIIPDITEAELNERLSDLFMGYQNELNSENIDLTEYKLFEVREPYREYELEGFMGVRFYAVLKSDEGKYIKFHFIDCLKTESGYLFADDLEIKVE